MEDKFLCHIRIPAFSKMRQCYEILKVILTWKKAAKQLYNKRRLFNLKVSMTTSIDAKLNKSRQEIINKYRERFSLFQ